MVLSRIYIFTTLFRHIHRFNVARELRDVRAEAMPLAQREQLRLHFLERVDGQVALQHSALEDARTQCAVEDGCANACIGDDAT